MHKILTRLLAILLVPCLPVEPASAYDSIYRAPESSVQRPRSEIFLREALAHVPVNWPHWILKVPLLVNLGGRSLFRPNPPSNPEIVDAEYDRMEAMLLRSASGAMLQPSEIHDLRRWTLSDPTQRVFGVSWSNVDDVVQARLDFLRQHWQSVDAAAKAAGVVETVIGQAWRTFIPEAQWIVQRKRELRPNQAYIYGVNASWGGGKTVRATILKPIIQALLPPDAGQVVFFSIDDYYKTKAARLVMKILGYDFGPASNRGPGGTHDMLDLLRHLVIMRNSTATTRVRLFRFNKGIDDRDYAAMEKGEVFGKVAVVIMDGGTVGVPTDIDLDRIQNGALARQSAEYVITEYKDVFKMLDDLLAFAMPPLERIRGQRLKQEQTRRRLDPQNRGMTDQETIDFVDGFYLRSWDWRPQTQTYGETAPVPRNHDISLSARVDAKSRVTELVPGGRLKKKRPAQMLPEGSTYAFGDRILINLLTGDVKPGPHYYDSPQRHFVVGRHTKTGLNVGGLFQGGDSDPDLKGEGLDDARRVAGELLKAHRQDIVQGRLRKIYTSPLLRAKTLAVEFQRLVQSDPELNVTLEIIEVPELRGIRVGELEAQSLDEKQREQAGLSDPEAINRFLSGTDFITRPQPTERYPVSQHQWNYLHQVYRFFHRLQNSDPNEIQLIIGHGDSSSALQVLLGDRGLIDEDGRLNLRRGRLSNGEFREYRPMRPVVRWYSRHNRVFFMPFLTGLLVIGALVALKLRFWFSVDAFILAPMLMAWQWVGPNTLNRTYIRRIEEIQRWLDSADRAHGDRETVKTFLDQAKALMEQAVLQNRARGLMASYCVNYADVDASLLRLARAYADYLGDMDTAFVLACETQLDERGMLWNWLIRRALENGDPPGLLVKRLRTVSEPWIVLPLLELLLSEYVARGATEPPVERDFSEIIFATRMKLKSQIIFLRRRHYLNWLERLESKLRRGGFNNFALIEAG